MLIAPVHPPFRDSLRALPGSESTLGLVKSQYEIDKIISPLLYAGIEWDTMDEPFRWWPLGRERDVVIDPSRAFGAPIVAKSRIPTEILERAARVEGSIEAAAEMYEVDVASVAAAVEFEQRHM